MRARKVPEKVVQLPVRRATDESFAKFGVVIDPTLDQRIATEILAAKGVFGYYPQGVAKTINPDGEVFVSSPLKMEPRPAVVCGKMEFHRSREGLIFYDRVILVVGPPAPVSGRFEDLPKDPWAAFAFDACCWAMLKPRVLHTLAFPWDEKTVKGSVLLPFAAHQTDLSFVDFPEGLTLKPVRPATFPRG